MRESNNQLVRGFVYNGYDYSLQVWVVNGIIQPCGHPKEMNCVTFCSQKQLAGKKIEEVKI